MDASLPENPHARRIARLRQWMRNRRVDACLVLSSDPHLSEYLPERWQGRRWLCGFDGSAGTLAITIDAASLWVDGRYWEEAERQLRGTGVAMMPLPASRQPAYLDWLCGQTPKGGCVAVDGNCLSVGMGRLLEARTREFGLRLRTDMDLLQAVWDERPLLPAAPVRAAAIGNPDDTRRLRIARLRETMVAKGCQWHLVSALDEIAWLLELRGGDIPFNPVFVAHLLVGPDQATLFVNARKLGRWMIKALADDGVGIRPYADAAAAVGKIGAHSRLLLDPDRTTVGMLRSLKGTVARVEGPNPCMLAKSVKCEAEIAGIRRAMVSDGAALCDFFAWMDRMAQAVVLTEFTVGEQLSRFRSRQDGFAGPSFGTIAGFNANGAMPHYRAGQRSAKAICGDGLLLVDSGGHYEGGTTDVTRMRPVGKVSDGQKKDVTLVLKGLIALSSSRFPKGIRAPMLDAIARAPLWREGIDYGHGTGHGVGCFLNVHEGPQSISFRADAGPSTEMKAGMVTSIEPGIYRPGQWGARIENLVLAREAAACPGEFLEFETLTLCPIDLDCVDIDLLTEAEIDWLDAYHALVRQRLLPVVARETRTWLHRKTERIMGHVHAADADDGAPARSCKGRRRSVRRDR